MKLTKELIFTPRNYPESSWTGHAPFAAWLMKVARPRVFVELGTHAGFSYFGLCQAAQEGCVPVKCFAVDTWQGDAHAGFYARSIFKDVSTLNEQYRGFSTLLRMTFDEALKEFQNGTVDLLHIDGFHSYEAVRHDFETWAPKLSDQAIVLFHDIAVRERSFGVWRLWEELEANYPTFHFDHTHGLGVLFYGPNASEQVKQALLDRREGQTIRELFAQLGDRLEILSEKANWHQTKTFPKRVERKLLGLLRSVAPPRA